MINVLEEHLKILIVMDMLYFLVILLWSCKLEYSALCICHDVS